MDAEANYRSLVETASDAIISFDREHRIILWNSSAEQIFGYSKGEAFGSPVFGTFIPEEHADTLTKLIGTSRSISPPSIIEIVARHKNGVFFPIEVSAFGRMLPGGWVSTCIVRDVTERKQMEEALRENQSRLDLALRSAQMGVWHLDINENIRVFDNQVCNLLGIDGAKFTGAAEEFFDALHPGDHDRVSAALAQTTRTGCPL